MPTIKINLNKINRQPTSITLPILLQNYKKTFINEIDRPYPL